MSESKANLMHRIGVLEDALKAIVEGSTDEDAKELAEAALKGQYKTPPEESIGNKPEPSDPASLP